MIDDWSLKLDYEYIAHIGTIGMREHNLVVLLFCHQILDEWNDN